MNSIVTPYERGRAWVEIDLNALAKNLADIRSKLPANCEIMAVVKADAYGHGITRVAERMIYEGIRTFAVATVAEGVELREIVTDETILVLGYTHQEDVYLLSEYKLTQLVVDGAYAGKLNDAGYELKVHIAIDTGMHRLGIEPSNFDEIESIFCKSNLVVEGVATHLSSPDSFLEEDIDFTNKQMDKFAQVVKSLIEKGYNVGKLHAQSSYGIYNYPEIQCDYARPGIMLYGVKSQNDTTKVKTELHPVLTLKAVIAQVRWIGAGESVSYSRTYTVDRPTKIATVSIGYADGIPRQISGNGGNGLVSGHKVPIIGRVCMDMIILDVTGVEHVGAGDIVTLIGKDKDEQIRAEDVAEAAGTITNDLLSGLSKRLPRIYI